MKPRDNERLQERVKSTVSSARHGTPRTVTSDNERSQEHVTSTVSSARHRNTTRDILRAAGAPGTRAGECGSARTVRHWRHVKAGQRVEATDTQPCPERAVVADTSRDRSETRVAAELAHTGHKAGHRWGTRRRGMQCYCLAHLDLLWRVSTCATQMSLT